MYNLKNKLKIILKVILIFFVFYYLITNIDLDFIEKLKKYYFLIFIIIPIFLIQIILNSLKISYLIKIIKKKAPGFKKIFYIMLTAELSTAFPASFLTSKAWVDTNLIKNFKLTFKDYIKVNLFIYVYSSLIVISLLIFIKNLTLLFFLLSIIFILSVFWKKYKNYSMYFYFFALNLIANISISFIVIYFVNSEVLHGNLVNIFISTIISVCFNMFSLLPFNIGYAQMVYSITFDYFSLPLDLAIIITTVKQISQVFIVIFVAIFLAKNIKKNLNIEKYH
tara:strand:+ start:209 stop:1048 length:840 start_codon:yes stop_codon:yes gene_type:complete